MTVPLHPDFRELLAELGDAGVRYLIVGGYAVSLHARPRSTKDIDLWIANDAENLARVAGALERFGAPQAIVESVRHLGPDEFVFMGRPPLRVDFLCSLSGVDFDTAFPRKVTMVWDGLEIPVIGAEDLLANKRAAGRPQDLRDARAIERASGMTRRALRPKR